MQFVTNRRESPLWGDPFGGGWATLEATEQDPIVDLASALGRGSWFVVIYGCVLRSQAAAAAAAAAATGERRGLRVGFRGGGGCSES